MDEGMSKKQRLSMSGISVPMEPNYTAPDAEGRFSPDTKKIMAALLAEFLGTMFFVFIAVGIQANEIKWVKDGETDTDPEGVSRLNSGSTLLVGFSYAVVAALLMTTFERVSGAHFNPAITLATMVARRMGPLPAALYILVQITGAVCGAKMYDGMSGNDNYGDIAVNEIENSFDTGSIFGVELMATFLVTLVWFFSLDLSAAPCGRHRTIMGPLYCGGAYFLAACLTTRWDRVGLNPARSFGVSAVTGEWDQHWVYWMGPMIGSMSGALVFELFLWLGPDNRQHAKQAF
jgi:MIP family channel proteins